jgi:hypothetical protein
MDGLVEIVLDCRHAASTARFWATALDWEVRPYDEEEIARLADLGLTPDTDPSVAVDEPEGLLVLFCTEVPEPKTGKNRMHLDVRIQNRARLDQLIALGAQVLQRDGRRMIMADPEGNEFCAVGVPEDWNP